MFEKLAWAGLLIAGAVLVWFVIDPPRCPADAKAFSIGAVMKMAGCKAE